MNPQLQAAFKRALRFGQSRQSQSDDRGTQREIVRKKT